SERFIPFHVFVSLYLCGSLLLLSVLTAKAADKDKYQNGVSIKNFGKVDDRLYRGGQPKEEQFQELSRLGITTVIDLRDDPKDYEKSAVEAAGMCYINLPMSDSKLPGNEQAAEYLRIVNNPETGTAFVHCAGGRHRTGVMVAIYRLNNYGWNVEQAYKEMKEYDFYTRWGHGVMKDF